MAIASAGDGRGIVPRREPTHRHRRGRARLARQLRGRAGAGRATRSRPTRRAPDALAAFRTRLPDLALIDIGLGDDIDGGFELCARRCARCRRRVPIIFLSARDSEFDIVAGLRLGADDYLTKDASLPHLAARIAALFRRSDLASRPRPSRTCVERGPLTLDVKRLTARWRDNAGRPHAHRILDGARAGALSRATSRIATA